MLQLSRLQKNIAIILCFLAVAGGLYYWQLGQKAVELPPITVRLGWVHQAQFAGFYVAEQKGFYEEAGLSVEILESDFASSQTAEVASGEVEASVMEAHQLLGDSDNLESLIAVAAIYQINPHSLAVREDSGINSPKDFTGKTVGLAGGESEGSALFEIFINEIAGKDSVTYKELGFDTVNDFLNNRADIIDVYRIDQPYLAAQKGVPLKIIPLEAYGFSTYGDLLVMNRSFTEEYPEATKRFVQATMKGWQYAIDNPTEAAEISLMYASGDYADLEYQKHIIYESLPLIRGNVRKLGTMELVPWSNLYESMLRVGVVKKDIDIQSLFTNKFLK